MTRLAEQHEEVRDYYSRVIRSHEQLRTDACRAPDSLPERQGRALELLDAEITARFYGCGSPIPLALEGATVLDLGCGTGRDSYIVSYLVGPEGRVIGVDMTEEQLEVARRHRDAQMRRFGFDRPNIDFRHGYIEDLRAVGIEDESIDVVTSNCVINLSPDQRAVFREIFRVLKPGGELYFSDVFAGRRVPEHLRHDPVLVGECLAGALYMEDFRRLLREIGCPDCRSVSRRRVTLDGAEIERKIGMVDFYSVTVRAFKMGSLEDACEDYGQVAVYKGTIADSPHQFILDDHHRFIAGKPALVCGNTASMLSESRYAAHFEVRGDRSVHYGLFECGPASAKLEADEGGSGGACC